jgi:hypothetical protein
MTLKEFNTLIFILKKKNSLKKSVTNHIEQGFSIFRHLSHIQYPLLEISIGLKQLLHVVYIVVDCCCIILLFQLALNSKFVNYHNKFKPDSSFQQKEFRKMK